MHVHLRYSRDLNFSDIHLFLPDQMVYGGKHLLTIALGFLLDRLQSQSRVLAQKLNRDYDVIASFAFVLLFLGDCY